MNKCNFCAITTAIFASIAGYKSIISIFDYTNYKIFIKYNAYLFTV